MEFEVTCATRTDTYRMYVSSGLCPTRVRHSPTKNNKSIQSSSLLILAFVVVFCKTEFRQSPNERETTIASRSVAIIIYSDFIQTYESFNCFLHRGIFNLETIVLWNPGRWGLMWFSCYNYEMSGGRRALVVAAAIAPFRSRRLRRFRRLVAAIGRRRAARCGAMRRDASRGRVAVRRPSEPNSGAFRVALARWTPTASRWFSSSYDSYRNWYELAIPLIDRFTKWRIVC